VSYDLFFWEPVEGMSDEDACFAAAEGDTELLVHSEKILALRKAIVAEVPAALDYLEPNERDPDVPEEDFGKYIFLTIPLPDAGLANRFIDIANRYGVKSYDPQRDLE
jgi:hypothetical protein